MKKISLSLLILSLGLQCIAQTTLALKPNAVIGEDAQMWMLDDACIPWDMSTTPADENYGNRIEIRYEDWTWSAADCGSGTIRALLRFSGIAGVPAGATVISAELKLYGPPDFPLDPITNSVYPGSPYGVPNNGLLQRVTGPWNEATVTWNTQPSATTTDQKYIPVSATQYSWDISIDVTDFVTGFVAGTYPNYGFLLRLEEEEHYRSTMFASSDYADSLLWPELVIVYEQPEPPVDTTDGPIILPPDTTVHVEPGPGSDTTGNPVSPPVDTFKSCRVLMPNAFSPNNDGINDILKAGIENGCPLTNYSLSVFNRWGQLVFSSSDSEAGWDGYFSGRLCDIGTYLYEVSITTKQEGTKVLKGDVVLIR